MINDHWDGGWLENNLTGTVNPVFNAKMQAYWTQIATTFSGYDNHLLFAAANEPNVDNAPASLIDVLHRMCAFREKGDSSGMAEFLAGSGQSKNQALWLVAQAVSEILPDGDKEKQLMQGLLNQRDTLEEEARKGKLF